MSQVQLAARRQERFEHLCAAAMRALSGRLQLHYRGHRVHLSRRPLPLHAPHLHFEPGTDDFAACRGAADGCAMRLRCSDPKIHERLAPADPVERAVFELLEQYRVESMVPAALTGVRRNLRHAFQVWSRAFHHAGGTDSARGLLMFTVAQVCRARVTGDAILEELEDPLEATRAGIASTIGVALAGLRRERTDQARYAAHAASLARSVAALLHHSPSTLESGSQPPAEDRGWIAFSLEPDVPRDSDASVGGNDVGARAALGSDAPDYRVYTTAYDRQVDVRTLVRPELLVQQRARLDRLIAPLGLNVPRLAREFAALFAVATPHGWDTGQEEGQVDGRRLAQLISSPTQRRLFRLEHFAPIPDCVVGLLLDCSGSMTVHMESVAPLIDVLARGLEHAGVHCEVLGYTTGAWNGGRARRDWARAGRPPRPGRLNEVCHLVFKSADTPWRRARGALAAMLQPDLFREGIDGEAVAWAMRRLQAHEAQRRVLMVFSDGSPMDSATNLANAAQYLDRHLMEVVAHHERSGAEIYGVGVGLDLSLYFSRSHVLDLSRALSMGTLREVRDMLGRGARR